MEKVATPDAFSARPEASVVVLPPKVSKMLTVPVRLPVSAAALTVTVKVTLCPKPEGSRLEVTAVVVEAAVMVEIAPLALLTKRVASLPVSAM